MKRAAVLGALALLAAPAVARAQYARYPRPYAVTYAPLSSCPPDTGVVGRTRQGPFGLAWNGRDKVRASFRVGVGFHALSTQSLVVRGDHSGASYTAVPSQSGADVMWGATFDLGGSIFVFGPVFFGAELRAGGGGWNQFTATDDVGTVVLGGANGWRTLSGLVAFGAMLPMGRVRGRAELAGGYQYIWADAQGVPYYVTSPGGAARMLLEARVGLEAWITPWASAGAMLGMDVLHAPSASLALYVQFHQRGYDAMRGPVIEP